MNDVYERYGLNDRQHGAADKIGDLEATNADLLEALEDFIECQASRKKWSTNLFDARLLAAAIRAGNLIAKAKPEPKGEANRRTVQPAAKQGTVSRSAVREAVKKAKAKP